MGLMLNQHDPKPSADQRRLRSQAGRLHLRRRGVKVEGENKWMTLIQNAKRGPKVNREKTEEDGPST
jgi:hypothetical protein